MLQIVQLTSLRPSADQFCALLRDALKVELQRGQMKQIKGFVKSCYSEVLVSDSSTVPENEREDGSLITAEKDGNSQEINFHGGLGLKFKFPGDPKKYVLVHMINFSQTKLTPGFVRLQKSNCGQHIYKVNFKATLHSTILA